MTTSVIEASSLCRVFASEDGREPVRAVDGVTFAVPPEARLVALIGPDGAGKSTLMQMICGLVGQDSGSLSVLGRTPDPDDEDFVNAVGYMPQTLGLYKDLSVMENMKLFGALKGTKPPEGMTIEAYYASLIALTGLEGFEGRPAGKLSGGMKQKLALAVALAYMPSLMLSGFLFDLRSVPVWIEFVGRLLPPTYAVEAFKQCFLAGDGPILWRNVGILCCWAALFFCMAVRVLRKRPPVTVPDKSEPKGGASC